MFVKNCFVFSNLFHVLKCFSYLTFKSLFHFIRERKREKQCGSSRFSQSNAKRETYFVRVFFISNASNHRVISLVLFHFIREKRKLFIAFFFHLRMLGKRENNITLGFVISNVRGTDMVSRDVSFYKREKQLVFSFFFCFFYIYILVFGEGSNTSLASFHFECSEKEYVFARGVSSYKREAICVLALFCFLFFLFSQSNARRETTTIPLSRFFHF